MYGTTSGVRCVKSTYALELRRKISAVSLYRMRPMWAAVGLTSNWCTTLTTKFRIWFHASLTMSSMLPDESNTNAKSTADLQAARPRPVNASFTSYMTANDALRYKMIQVSSGCAPELLKSWFSPLFNKKKAFGDMCMVPPTHPRGTSLQTGKSDPGPAFCWRILPQSNQFVLLRGLL